MIDCNHTKLRTAFCPYCGETNELCTEGEKLTCVHLIKRAIYTATCTKERHRKRGARSNAGPAEPAYAEERMASLDRKLMKLNKALAWVQAQEGTQSQ